MYIIQLMVFHLFLSLGLLEYILIHNKALRNKYNNNRIILKILLKLFHEEYVYPPSIFILKINYEHKLHFHYNRNQLSI